MKMGETMHVVDVESKKKTNGNGHGLELHGQHADSSPMPEEVHQETQSPPKNEATDPAKPSRQPWLWALMGAAIVAATAGGIAYYIHSLSFESTDDAFIEGHIIPVSSRVAGHVAKVHVADNQYVHKGDLIAELDSSDFQTRLAAAEAALGAAHATSAARATGVAAALADLEQMKADLVAAEAREVRAKARLKRIESLVPERAASQDSLDEATAGVNVATADVKSISEKINAKQSAVEQAKSAVTAAKNAVRQAEAELEQAKLNHSYTRICAPIAGHVTRKSVEVGAFIQMGQPLLAVVDPDVWVVANFKETQLAKMQPGQPVTVAFDTHPGVKFSGHIDSIQRGSGARFSLLPPENATGNYVKVVQRVPVKIVFDDLEQIEKYCLGPGMSVVPIVRIDEPGRTTTASRSAASR
jgi:membrane fusion protein (multidrug efflux system)